MRDVEAVAPSSSARVSRRHWPVRYRLLVIALLPTLFVAPLLLGDAVYRWNTKFDGLLVSKVSSDLAVARQYLSRILQLNNERLVSLAEAHAFLRILEKGGESELDAFLEGKREELGLDFLYLVGEDDPLPGASSAGPGSRSPRDWPVVRSALDGSPRTALDVFDAGELAGVSAPLAERAAIELIPTARASPTDKVVEERGLVIHSASPVVVDGERPGALVGGILLNRNLDFIDTINELVYQKEGAHRDIQGTATLFLDDLRISTNVRLFEDHRALGTRVSSEVRDAVLNEGRTWLDRAFVVNDWYISAYEPVTDSHGERVGMLYVGFLEAPFRQAKNITFFSMGAVFLVAAILTVPIFLRWARSIFSPLERINRTISRVESGDLSARAGGRVSHDEIGRLVTHLDGLLDQVQCRDRELRNWADELNDRVDERTRELRHANEQLEVATRKLLQAERLAVIGEITTSIAHEINNPIAIIQGNIDVARENLGDKITAVRDEFSSIDGQIYRINEIVENLLQFAKPGSGEEEPELNSPRQLIEDSLLFVRHLLKKAHVEVKTSYHALGKVCVNRTECQQVLVNLFVNAIHAIQQAGVLTIGTRDVVLHDCPGVVIEVHDTGVGMEPDVVAKVFEPFYTTKRRDGTGLGLSISRNLVHRAGGRLWVASTPGQGSTFTVWLPSVAAISRNA